MEPLIIARTNFTPAVTFDKDRNIFEISGFSRPENVEKFYGPVLKWLNEYATDANQTTDIKFKFSYFNTSSLKYFLMLLDTLKKIHIAKRPVTISWFYHKDDEDMLEAGKMFFELKDIPFKFISYE